MAVKMLKEMLSVNGKLSLKRVAFFISLIFVIVVTSVLLITGNFNADVANFLIKLLTLTNSDTGAEI